MDNNTIKLVTRQESFNDFAVHELAKSKAKCMCCLQFKRCKKNDCASCATNTQYKNCVSLMNDYDKIRLKSYINDYYIEYSYDPVLFMGHKEYVKHMTSFYIKLFSVIFACLFLCGLLMFNPAGTPPSYTKTEASVKLNNAIPIVIREVRMNVKDLNRDNDVNCIDYAVKFWLVWTSKFSNKCEIVRNYNPGILHHLFVRIQDDDGLWIYVEPRAHNEFNYIIENVWKEQYNPNYNYHGETDYWVNIECGGKR